MADETKGIDTIDTLCRQLMPGRGRDIPQGMPAASFFQVISDFPKYRAKRGQERAACLFVENLRPLCPRRPTRHFPAIYPYVLPATVQAGEGGFKNICREI